MIKTDNLNQLMMSHISEESAKRMAISVIEKALDDYKRYPTERAAIERWILSGDIWFEIMFPDTDEQTILEGFRRYAKINE